MKTKIESAAKFKLRLKRLVGRLSSEGWSKGLERELMCAVDDVLDGRSRPVRLPPDTMRRERMIDMPKWFLAAYHMACGVDDSTTGKWDNPSANRVVEKVLKNLGKWHPDIYGKCRRSYGKPFGEGSESYVFKSGKDQVAKASNLSHTGNVVFAMERLMLSNLLFPDMAHHVVGMGSMHGDTKSRANDHIAFCLEQNRVKFEYFKTERAAEKAMSRCKFHRDFEDEYCDESEEIRLIDCKLINIPHDDSGRIVFIDSAATLNYGEAGKLKKLCVLRGPRMVANGNSRSEDWEARIGSVWNSPFYTADLDSRVKARAKVAGKMTWEGLRKQALAGL